MKIKDSTREYFSVDETASDKNYRFFMPGPEITEKELENIFDEIKSFCNQTEYLVVSGSLPESVPVNFYARLTEFCSDTKIKMIIDASGEALKKSKMKLSLQRKPKN